MNKLITPFGEIQILIDGMSVPYAAKEGRKFDYLCSRVLGRYQIRVSFIPDGKEHEIACIFDPSCLYKRMVEGGEHLVCQSFYNDQRYKMSIGLEFDEGVEEWIRNKYDYGFYYLENGMAFYIETYTKTTEYVFGICWIDDVGWDDPINSNDRDVETWYGADPTLIL